jgi:hypothetical protein
MLSGNIYTVPVQDTRKIQNYCNATFPKSFESCPTRSSGSTNRSAIGKPRTHTEKWHEGEIEFPQHVDDV